MITPLSHRPFHENRYKADALKDIITALFFAILGCFNTKWIAYSDYYKERAEGKTRAFEMDRQHLIQTSVNFPHPKKIREVPAPPPFKKEYLCFKERMEPLGYCNGMCKDFMRRVRNSNKPFYETIVEVANKFASGTTKKGYIYQRQIGKIFITESYFETSLRKLEEKITQDPTINAWRELVCKVRCKVENALDLGYKFKVFKHDFKPENHASIPNGDYILSISKKDGYGHSLCLFKRDESAVLFDPNHGTYFFQDPVKLYECVQKAGGAVFKGETVVELAVCI